MKYSEVIYLFISTLNVCIPTLKLLYSALLINAVKKKKHIIHNLHKYNITLGNHVRWILLYLTLKGKNYNNKCLSFKAMKTTFQTKGSKT